MHSNWAVLRFNHGRHASANMYPMVRRPSGGQRSLLACIPGFDCKRRTWHVGLVAVRAARIRHLQRRSQDRPGGAGAQRRHGPSQASTTLPVLLRRLAVRQPPRDGWRTKGSPCNCGARRCCSSLCQHQPTGSPWPASPHDRQPARPAIVPRLTLANGSEIWSRTPCAFRRTTCAFHCSSSH
jgi:hypothetical protein